MAAPVPFQRPHHGVPVDEKKDHGFDLEAASLSEGKPAANALHVERAALLANLPDPDADKTPEERAAIVENPYSK
ncbi:major facilitator superfamily domain-containing protein [Apiospora phragmitis]|uniref:Major facilitator superfamily domain-containing protein n=1 Tax=Apiospora phragmitis TaxID=2905665 RepID=A0ABR1WSX7_9PEZI